MEGNMSSSSSSSSTSNSRPANPQAIKRRRRTTKHELQVLEDLYAESRNPSLEARQKACMAIGFEMKALQVWLQNRRQKEKKDAGKWKPAYTATGESAANSSNNHSQSSMTAHSSPYSHSIASSRSSSASPEMSTHHAPLPPSYAPHPDHPRVNKLHASDLSAVAAEESAVKLPPMLLNTVPAHSSPPAQLPITLPSISTVMAESSSRDFDHLAHHHNITNKLSPILRQDENTFSRPPFQRTTSVDSVRSSSTACSSFKTEATAQQEVPSKAQVHAPAQLATRPIKALRRTSSQYSLSIAQDGKAQMLVTEVPMAVTQKPQLPSLETAILASSPSMSSPSTITSAGSENMHLTSSASSLRRFTSTLASAPFSSFNGQSLPFSKSNFGRVYSLPSLSTLSTHSATASLKSHNCNNTIFSGGLRPGPPPKKSTFPTISRKDPQQRKRSANDNSHHNNNELWMNLDSDPIEPEDEVIMNQNKRMLESPVKRFSSIKMEDVISSSSSAPSASVSSSSASSRKRKYMVMKASEVESKVKNHFEGNSVENITSLGGVGSVAVSLRLAEKTVPAVQKTASNVNASQLVCSATTTSTLSSSTSIPSSPSRSSISSFQAQLSSQGPKQSQTRKRSYSKTMLSRSISLDRVILHDDSTDEENSPQKKRTDVQHQPRSAGLYPSGTILGRPLLSRANSHLGILHSSSFREGIPVEQPVKKLKLDALKSSTNIILDRRASNDTPSREEEDVNMNTEERKEPKSPAEVSVLETSLEEPDLTFSTQASQSFDGMSRGEMSDVEMDLELPLCEKFNDKKESAMIRQAPVMDLIPEKVNTATAITSTPSKKQGNTLALAALKGHMSSPIKMGSPNKKIMTEVERDCAAVLVGLGVPDVF